jgi:polar amino acid transport system permease protein
MAIDWDWALVSRLLLSHLLIQGAWTTIWVAVVCQTSGTILGTIFALMQLSRNVVLRAIAALYSGLFRGTPLLVQILYVYAVLPQLGLRFGVIECGLLALGVNEGARMAEIIRAGIISVTHGQIEAAKALGMSGLQTFRLIEMPQAVRVIVPPLGNNFNSMLKATSLLAVIGFGELLRTSQMLANTTTRPLEVYITASLYYLVMTTVWGRIQAIIENRFRIKGTLDVGRV